MPNPRIFFRLTDAAATDLQAVATSFRTTPGRIAKLIVLREVSKIPALLEEQEKALQEIRQFHRDLAATLEDYLEEMVDQKRGLGLRQIISVLNAQSKMIDAIRAAAVPHSSRLIAMLVERHDEEPVQTAFPD
jgi:hypothetical protein